MSKLAPFILVALGSCATLDGYLERPVPTTDPAAPVVTVGEATADTVTLSLLRLWQLLPMWLRP